MRKPRTLRTPPRVHRAVAATELTASDELQMARQILETLRRPEDWYERIIEEITFVNDDADRRVSLHVNELAKANHQTASLYLVVAQPPKGSVQPIELEKYGSGDSARFLGHEEHVRVTNILLANYLGGITNLCRPFVVDEEALFASFTQTLARILEIARPEARNETVNKRLWGKIVRADGSLRGFPRFGVLPDAVRQETEDFVRLCRMLSVHYLKLIEIKDFDRGPRRVDLRYREDLTLGAKSPSFVRLRRWFRAPPPKFLIPLPFANLTNHYEVSFQPMEGYYVQSSRVMSRHEPEVEIRRTPRGTTTEPWAAYSPGGPGQSTAFVGNGKASGIRTVLSTQVNEVPPGAVGRAWAASGIGSITAVTMIWWSLAHGGANVPPTAALIPAFVAVGSAAVDHLMPKREVLNSPLLPRFALYTQTIAMLALSFWILIRGSTSSLNPVERGSGLDQFNHTITNFDVYFGLAIGVLVLVVFVVLSVRSFRSSRAYDLVFATRKYSEYPSPTGTSAE